MKFFTVLATLLFISSSFLSFGDCPLLVEKSGTITSSETWTSDNVYLIKGTLFVEAPAVLTIQAGTIIHGDRVTKGTLVIKPGAQIMAEGTANFPIVFTSHSPTGERDRGDWGGIVLLGNAPVNQNNPSIEGISPSVTYGGNNPTESSGTMKYIRIEYAGIALSPNNETNGLTFGGIGSGTTIENIQVSYGGDDGFEWFGGTVNCKNLISYANWDDDFDVDFGFSGNVQYGLALRDPFGADQSGSNAIEADNDGSGSANTPQTKAVFSNLTILGPRPDSAAAISANYMYGIFIRRNTAVSVFNSVITGFNEGIRVDNSIASTFTNYTGGTGVLNNNLIAMTNRGTLAPVFYVGSNGITNADVQTYCETTKSNTSLKIFTNPSKVADWTATGLTTSLFFNILVPYPANPDFTLTSGSLASGASFTDPKLSGFTATTYRGAFGATDWTDTWTEWNPQNAPYCYVLTGVFNPVNETKQFELYPNPTEGTFTISGKNEQTVLVTVVNSQGVKLLEKEMTTGQLFNMKENGCTKGIYFIKISLENKTETHKVILN